MRSRPVARPNPAALLCLAILAIGCGSAVGTPRIEAGAPCVRCGMETRDLRWAGARRVDGRVRIYDSIECALNERSPADATAGSGLYLTDFATAALHRADSLWIVRADIPSPMGGGFAAFLDRSAAERVALERNGRAGRLADFAPGDAPGANDAPVSGGRP